MSKKKDSLKPWLSRPAINRSVTLPLTRPLTQRLSNLNEFHPNELDPYLLFDARDSMIGTLENPTLDLDPSKPDTLNVITATRAGTATFTDVNGLIASAPANTVRVDHVDGVPMILVEPSATNLLPYSEDFSNSAWSKSSTTVTSNESTSPDGLNNASLVTVNSASISHLRDFFPISAAAHTFSIYAKAGTTTNIQLYVIEQGVGSGTADVDIQSGVVTNVSSEWNGGVTTENIGNGWFRIRGTRTFTTSASNHGIGVAATGQNGLNFYIWGAQVETGSVATSLIPTSGGNTAARTRAADDLQIERDSTNLLPYSEDFSQWSTKSGATLTANYGISPDGTQNSTRLQFSGASNQLADNITTSSSSTGSVWVKGTSGETIRFGVYASEANFTLNGSWQRIQKQGTATSNILTINTYGGATARDLEIWGGQLEDGSEATSYIPTSGAAASRTTFSDFFSSSEGTFYAEYQFNDADGANSIIYGSADNQRFAYKNYGSTSPLLSYDGVNVLKYRRLDAGTLLRTALSFDSNSIEGSQDGSAANMHGQTVPFPHNGNLLSATELNIGSNTTGAKHLNGHIKRLIYWPYHSDSL